MSLANLIWDQKGLPRSVRFDDHFFCRENGLAESRHVFCGGNRLENRWRDEPHRTRVFTIVETGFGTGLNFLCAWRLLTECGLPGLKLHFISIERYPFEPSELRKALTLWPTLKELADQLVQEYQPQENAVQYLQWEGGKISLTLIYQDVLDALDFIRDQKQYADAFFLDGFAPAKNPQMWTQEVFVRLASLSREGGTFATFTAAGHVRRGLRSAGFQTSLRKGYAYKRHMLIGRYGA